METPQLGSTIPSGNRLIWQGIFFAFLQRNIVLQLQLWVSARAADVS